MVPLGNFIKDTFVAAWNALGSAVKWVYDTFLKPVFDAIQWAWDNILKPVGDFLNGVGGALCSVGNAIGGALGLNKPAATTTTASTAATVKVPKLAEGGIVNEPTLAIVGEAGAERITPLDRADSGGGRQVIFNAPLLQVDNIGSRQDADYVLRQMQDMLQSVQITNGGSTSKITFGSRGNLAPSSNL